ncbi:MAG: hypothetical protein KGL43_17495 [Burkholderiales bacterium]|nr:hypothetical protein [Burkholderiales bacterium]MDE2395808.1 hypothetical protein [Burkholderiales bacterium]MDE2455385.1 hypothetical protein [Burkholderiales bacterium]
MIEPIALPVQRRTWQPLHQVWAPKLGRILMFTRPEQLHLWVMLEAHPAVTRYCERPSSGDSRCPAPAADFWALRDGVPVWLRLADEPQDGAATAGPDVQAITAEALQRHRHWITNWLSLLPYLSSVGPSSLRLLQVEVLDFVIRQARLVDIEHHFARTDPILVRTAVIGCLHEGSLVSLDLQRAPRHRGPAESPPPKRIASCDALRFPRQWPTRAAGRASMSLPSPRNERTPSSGSSVPSMPNWAAAPWLRSSVTPASIALRSCAGSRAAWHRTPTVRVHR